MLLTTKEFAKLVTELDTPVFAFDFETNGLNPRIAKAFIMGFAYPGFTGCVKLNDPAIPEILRLLFSKRIKLLAHNARFELHFLYQQWGIKPAGDVWDTEVMAVLQNNQHFKKPWNKEKGYGLQACAERIGLTKYPPMLDWLKKKGNKSRYHEAPDKLIIPYVEQDAQLSLKLFEDQRKTFINWDKNSSVPISKLVRLEMDTTKNLFEMESVGLLLDTKYCEEAISYEQKREAQARSEFKELTGEEYVQSAKRLTPIFERHGIPFGRTPEVVDPQNGVRSGGNPSFDSDSLLMSKGHPITESILAIRASEKRVSTYWKNYLELHESGIIYPEVRQAGTATGRFSCINPNLQNIPDDSEDSECQYPIRRAFIARPGSSIVSIDYSAMEYRMLADEAGDQLVIQEILDKVDPHQKVADLAGVPRKLAKSVRFAKQYGAGVPKICEMTGISEADVRRIMQAMDQAAPRCVAYSRELIEWAKNAGWGYNYMGRRYIFADSYYKYSNYRIQGKGADVLRVALRDLFKFINSNNLKTKILIVIHDEIIFDVPENELCYVTEYKRIMMNACVYNQLPPDGTVSVGLNMHDLEEKRK